MIHTYFLGVEAFVVLGYLLGSALFPKRYPLIFYKFFGIALFMLVLWYLALATGAGWTSLVPVVFLLLVGVSVLMALYWKKRLHLPERGELLKFLGIEIISYLLFLLLVYIRTFKTDILGTEKLMDVALINAIMKQNQVPIENPWFAGFYMNYYYFGHFVLGVFQYLFQIPTAVGYNLAISLIGVWIVQAGYLVARALRISDLISFVLSLVMTFGGNLYLLIQTLQNHRGNQWFASATRVIPYTINEFPAYSVVLGDLHGHYLSYPFFLVGIFLLLDIFFPPKEKSQKPERAESVTVTSPTRAAIKEWILPKSIFLGILLGYLYLTNSWDIFTLAAFGGVLAVAVVFYWRNMKKQEWSEIIAWIKRVGLFIVLPIAALSVPQLVISRSYYLPPVGGIGFNTVYSGPWEMFMLFGQFVFIVALGGVLLWYMFRRVSPHIQRQLQHAPDIVLPLLLLVTAVLLILAVEFVYAKDIFSTLNPPYARTNTVFKIYFHAWSLLALGSLGFFISVFKNILRHIRPPKWISVCYAVFSIITAVIISYSFISVDQYIAPQWQIFTLKRVTDPRWSNGYSYMRDQHGADYDLVSYLLTQPYAKILEIVTYDSYSYNGRISAYTGLTAVSGWPLHNVQWYNGYEGQGKRVDTKMLENVKVSERVTDIEKMYTSTNNAEVRALLDKYEVTYVVFGNQELAWAKDKEKTLNTAVYNSLCRIEWQKQDATLYNCAKR